MALSPTDLKKGQLLQIDGTPFRVVEYAQKVMGRGGSIVNVKIKSLVDGKVLDKTFKGNDSIDSADVSSKKLQFLYSDGTMCHFMDGESYEQFELPVADLTHELGFMKESDQVTALSFDGRIIAIELPKNVPLQVVHTTDVVKGDTTSSVLKDAELETGITVKVPAFIKNGDLISVDTESGAYRERIKS